MIYLAQGNSLSFRDIVKKKRDEHLKVAWRMSPAHKKLQYRMEQMRKFRRQHEQLRSVIVRVLRPAAAPPVKGGNGEQAPPAEGGDTIKTGELEPGDLSAIEEVSANFASPSSVDAYSDRRPTPNFELWVEIFCVLTCFHVRILKLCLSVPREKKSS